MKLSSPFRTYSFSLLHTHVSNKHQLGSRDCLNLASHSKKDRRELCGNSSHSAVLGRFLTPISMFNIDMKDMYHCNLHPERVQSVKPHNSNVTSHSGNTSAQYSKEPAWRFDVCAPGLDRLEPRQTNDTSPISFQAQKRQTSFV